MHKTTVLYVEDEDTNRAVFKISFSKHFNVITADSGESGLELIDQIPNIEHVISDFRMPEMNGLEFIEKARMMRPEISYYIVSGYHSNDEIALALEKRLILKYFKKPFNAKEIVASIYENLKDPLPVPGD